MSGVIWIKRDDIEGMTREQVRIHVIHAARAGCLRAAAIAPSLPPPWRGMFTRRAHELDMIADDLMTDAERAAEMDDAAVDP